MGFLDLFVVALMPVLKTLLVTAVGLFLALDSVDILGSTARHHLNNLVFFVFTPALVGSSLADTITASNIVSLWFMPVNILLTFIIGSALGWILVKITRTPHHLQGLVIGCCAAGNLGNLLLIIIPAVCEETNSPFGDSSTCSTNGEAYASLSMAIGAVYIWTYVYNIIRVYANGREDSSLNGDEESSEEVTREASVSKDSLASVSKDSLTSYDYEAQPLTQSFIQSDAYDVQVPFFERVKLFIQKMNLKMLIAPSTIATIVGLFIGVVSPVRKLMVGSSATLRVIDSSAAMLGEAAIPAMTLIVGSNLLKGLKRSGVGVWVVIGVQVVRYIAMPLVGILIVKGAQRFGMVGSDDSLYIFVLLLQYALPSAMAIGTMTQLFGVGESECSVLMLWNYAAASLSLTLWATFYMWLVS